MKKMKMLKMTKTNKLLIAVCCCIVICFLMATPVLAEGDISGVIEQTWASAREQIQTVVNNVVFPALDLVLGVCFFVKVGTAFFDYRKTGHIEFGAPVILFVCLIFTLTAPLYIWQIV